MNKYKYKVGDRVRITHNFIDSTIHGMCGTIIDKVGLKQVFFAVRIDGTSDKDWRCMHPDEIELLPRKGQQIFFDFMY